MSSENINDEFNLPRDIKNLLREPIAGLAALKETFSTFDRTVNDRKYHMIALIMAVYYRIISVDDLKREFLKLVNREKHIEKIAEKKMLLLVFRYVLGAPKDGPLYERARIYSGSMEAAAAEKIPPKAIPALIREANGIEELYARHKRKSDGGASKSNDTENAAKGQKHSDNERAGSMGRDAFDETSKRESTDLGNVDISPNPKQARDQESSHRLPSKREGRPVYPKVPFDQKIDLVMTFESSDELYDFLECGSYSGTIEYKIIHIGNDPPKVNVVRWSPFE